MNKKTKLTIRSSVRLANVCVVLALTASARAELPNAAEPRAASVPPNEVVASAVGPTFTLEGATISNGGGVLPDGSIVIIGQTTAGTMSSENFTMEVGPVPILAQAGAPTCPTSTEPSAELIGVDISTKNRFLSFSAGDASSVQGIRVTFVSLPAPFDLWNGAELWVGPTSQVSEVGADVIPTGGPTFTAATLRCTPFFTDWSSLGVVHVFHEGIVPGGSYLVDVIDETCDADVTTSFSDPLPMTTAVWGDTVLDLADIPPAPPNGPPVDVVDALGVLGAFSNALGAIIKTRADLEPACVDLKINVSDVLSSLTGFSGLLYPFTPTAGDPCNSTCPNVLP